MNNQALQYVRGIFLRNDVVYIDASALMNFDELRRFLEKYGSIIRETGTVIIIPAAVRCEIASFLGSEDEDKDHKALECIDVLDKYRDLFELEGGDLSDVDYENVSIKGLSGIENLGEDSSICIKLIVFTEMPAQPLSRALLHIS